MRKNLRAECYAETESHCEDMYVAWLEDRVFALEAKVEKFTADNTASTPLCDDCATNKVAVSVCEPCLLKMIHRGA